MTYIKFEDIKVWKEAREFNLKVHQLIVSHERITQDRILVDQIRRASISIMLNIAEGFERKSKKEFAHYLSIAKGSAGEIRSILHLMKDLNLIDDQIHHTFVKNIESISAQLFNFRNFLVNN